MKTAIVNFSDVVDTEKNPTLCLSALRYAGGCYQCQIFSRLLHRNNFSIEETLRTLNCKPIITDEVIEGINELKGLIEEKKSLKARIAEIEEKLTYGT